MRTNRQKGMKVVALALALFAAGAALAQAAPRPAPIKLKIRSADPWAVKAMLEGIPIQQPEISSLPGFGGLGGAVGQGAARLFANGRLMVNPTDNSLWFFPDP